MNTVTIKITSEIKDQIIAHYKNMEVTLHDEPYVIFKAEDECLKVEIFKNLKGKYKAVFYGNDALKEALLFDKTAKRNVPKEHENLEFLNTKSQIGSDEVGTGDFLLPVIVVASYLSEENFSKVMALGIKDSKKLSDEKIREIGKELVKFIPYSKLTLHIEKYNDVVLKGDNLNAIKAKMHNSALNNMKNKFPHNPIYIDQFCSKSLYYQYLIKSKDVLLDVNFYTKGESRFPSIAVSSIIARYSFLLEKDYLENKYQMEFPFGAGQKVDDFSKEFVKRYGLEEFKKIAKHHFKNYQVLLDSFKDI